MLGYCKDLVSLDLSECRQLAGIAGLKSCTRLVNLSLALCEDIDLQGLNNTSIHNLDLSFCGELSNMSEIGLCRDIRRLDLSYNDVLSDASELSHCASLYSLNLSYCDNLENVCRLESLTNLHTLIVSGCHKLTDLSGLQSCVNLKHLDVSDCTKLTDEHLHTLLGAHSCNHTAWRFCGTKGSTCGKRIYTRD